MEEKRDAYRILVGRPEGRRPLGRPRRLVFSFDILPPIIFKRHSKSVGAILIKFLNPDQSSNFRVSKRVKSMSVSSLE
jgi:hypothetical protein